MEKADALAASGKAEDPLDPPIILRSNGDFLQAQTSAQADFVVAFKKIDVGEPLNDADRTNLVRGARLCQAMAAYLPGQAEGQDFKCAQALAALGYHRYAIQHYKQVLDAIGPHPTNDLLAVVRADSFANMSVSLVATGDAKAAMTEVAEALKAYPNTPTYLMDRAGAEAALGQKDAAVKDLKAAIQQSKPDDPTKGKAEARLKKLTLK